jgi:putative DNA primase/helicase
MTAKTPAQKITSPANVKKLRAKKSAGNVEVAVSVFTSGTMLSKTFALDDDEKIVKTAAADMYEGIASHLLLPFKELPELLKVIDPCQAIGVGVFDDKYGDSVKISTVKRLNASPKDDAIARTKENFKYPVGVGLGMFDHDPSEFGQMSPEELLGAMAKIDPQIANAARVVRGSVSAGVHRVGEEPQSGKGFHIYFAVKEASDFPRYTNTMHERLQLAGLGHIVITGNGVMKARSCIDTCVASPERLIFEGQPVIQDDRLTYSAPEPRFTDGALLYTKALPDLTPAERAELVKWETAEKKQWQPAADAQKLVWLDNYVAMQIDRGMSPDEARAKGEACQTMGDDLYGEFILQFKNRGDVTVAEVLENAPLYNGQPCVDPRELRGMYPADSAWFYWNDGYPIIRSFGHGGAIFKLFAEDPGSAEIVDRELIDRVIQEMPIDDTVWRGEEFLDALLNLEDSSGIEFERVAKQLKSLGVGRLKLDETLKKRKAAHKAAASVAGGNQPPNSNQESKLAERIASILYGSLAYDDTSKDWYSYENGLWSAISELQTLDIILNELNTQIPNGYAAKLLGSVEKLLRIMLRLNEWECKSHLLPMANGVLDTQTMELCEHDYEYFFNWQLPYDYDPEATIDVISRWLLDASDGDVELINSVRAFFKMALVGGELQKILELIGPGGSGKSTLIRLLKKLVGEKNVVTTDLRNLEENRFEPAKLYGKRVALISDSRRFGGEVAVLKQLTGGDSVRLEKKNIQQTGDFVYRGVVAIVANEAIQAADYTSGLIRRRMPVNFNRQITDEDKAKWSAVGGIESAMELELPGLLNWVLAMTDDEVSRAIGGINGEMNQAQREHLVATHRIAQWLDDNIVVEPDAVTYVGCSMKKKELCEADEARKVKLYANFEGWCDEQAVHPVAPQRFTANLIDVCKQLKINVIAKNRSQHGRPIKGLAIRSERHADCPTPVTRKLLDTVDESRRGKKGQPVKAKKPRY